MEPSAKYLYYPGCSLKGTGIAYEESLLTTFRLLELPIQELPDWNCCGATTYMSVSETSASCWRQETWHWHAGQVPETCWLHAMPVISPCARARNWWHTIRR